ncbi:MAG: DeoR/GlpR family DNA-binding transcription regulator [Peptostreptococcaceae bacterium]
MLKIDRLNKIESYLHENGSVIVSQLSQDLNVTEETIRRDLELLEKQKKLKRVRGGAFLPDKFDKEVPIKIRESIYNEEKQTIANHCIEYIDDGDSILLDASTTAIHLAKLIKESEKKITIITNSLKVSQIFENHKLVKVICLGGRLRSSSNSLVGSLTSKNLKEYWVDKSFISCSGLDLKFGITDNHEDEAVVRRNMLEHSSLKFLIVDHTKFDSSSMYKICTPFEVDVVITDKKLSNEWQDKFVSSGVKVIY